MSESDLLTYNSRDGRDKTPYGAVPAGRTVAFTLRPRRAEGFSRAVLTVRFEFESRTEEHPLAWTDWEGDRDVFSGTLETGKTPGLLWYSFRLEGFGGRERTLGEYQLTVYDGEEAVPGWFGNNVTYQIFPDRFCRTAVPSPKGLVGKRKVHKNWEEEPEYRPDRAGKVRNRDFFGGNFEGVIQKLDDLKALGVGTLYFNPVFEGAENHRYGTGDYETVDPMLGTNDTFSVLCSEAHARGMRVVLDGVFNHAGYVSRYFNGDGSYPDLGAAQSKESPYYGWFSFHPWPHQYDAWWGMRSLPAFRKENPDYRTYIAGGRDSIVRRWLRAGADGWRLDVADELPDDLVALIHTAVRAEKPDGIVIGEVWEDGSNKVAYGVRRKHILGGHCDGLMNYPFRNGVLDYLLGGDAARFQTELEQLRENYPPFAFFSAMNFLGTHDTPRILTLLGVGSSRTEQTKDWRAVYRMTTREHRLGVARLKVGAAILYAFPGSPTVFYGDEAGLEGFEDPFNRRTYPWGRENEELLDWYTALGKLRAEEETLRTGSLHWYRAKGPLLVFSRNSADTELLLAANAGEKVKQFLLPPGLWVDCMTGAGAVGWLHLAPVQVRLFRRKRREE